MMKTPVPITVALMSVMGALFGTGTFPSQNPELIASIWIVGSLIIIHLKGGANG